MGAVVGSGLSVGIGVGLGEGGIKVKLALTVQLPLIVTDVEGEFTLAKVANSGGFALQEAKT
jgi:hypothetical protein